MLTREMRDKWADALESGKFLQTRTRLITSQEMADKDKPAGYCCIGVFGRVCLGLTDDELNEIDVTGGENSPYKYLRTLGVEPVIFWRFNDRNRMTFQEIAVEVRKLPVEE